MLENVDLISLVLLVVGGLATLVGFFKLIQHGMVLLIWIALLLVGIWGVSYGWTQMEHQIKPALPDEIRKQLEAVDVSGKLGEWCKKLN